MTVTATGGVAPFSGEAVEATIAVNELRDAPVLVTSYDAVLTAIEEDFAEMSIVGDTVATLLPSGAITDIAGNPMTAAIAVTGVDDENGTWQFKLAGGTWETIETASHEPVSDEESLLLGPSDSVRFVPDADFSGAATFAYRAWDQTSGDQTGESASTTRQRRRDVLQCGAGHRHDHGQRRQ